MSTEQKIFTSMKQKYGVAVVSGLFAITAISNPQKAKASELPEVKDSGDSHTQQQMQEITETPEDTTQYITQAEQDQQQDEVPEQVTEPLTQTVEITEEHPIFVQNEKEVVASGTRASADWTLDDTGKLSLKNNGKTWTHKFYDRVSGNDVEREENYSFYHLQEGDTSWGDYSDQITSIEFVDDFYGTNLDYFFGQFTNVKTTENIKGLEHLKNVTSMRGAFSGSNFEYLDLTDLDVSNVDDFSYCFKGSKNLTTIKLNSHQVGKWSETYPDLRGQIIKYLRLQSMFEDCNSLTDVTTSGFNTRNCINTTYMFGNCYNLRYVDVSSWNMENVRSTQHMFNNCRNLIRVDVSKWNTQSLSSVSGMFSGCRSLQELDLSGWVTSGFAGGLGGNSTSMLSGCKSLEKLDLSGWDTSHIENKTNFLSSLNSLKELKLGENFHNFKNEHLVNGDNDYGIVNYFILPDGVWFNQSTATKENSLWQIEPDYLNKNEIKNEDVVGTWVRIAPKTYNIKYAIPGYTFTDEQVKSYGLPSSYTQGDTVDPSKFSFIPKMSAVTTPTGIDVYTFKRWSLHGDSLATTIESYEAGDKTFIALFNVEKVSPEEYRRRQEQASTPTTNPVQTPTQSTPQTQQQAPTHQVQEQIPMQESKPQAHETMSPAQEVKAVETIAPKPQEPKTETRAETINRVVPQVAQSNKSEEVEIREIKPAQVESLAKQIPIEVKEIADIVSPVEKATPMVKATAIAEEVAQEIVNNTPEVISTVSMHQPIESSASTVEATTKPEQEETNSVARTVGAAAGTIAVGGLAVATVAKKSLLAALLK